MAKEFARDWFFNEIRDRLAQWGVERMGGGGREVAEWRAASRGITSRRSRRRRPHEYALGARLASARREGGKEGQSTREEGTEKGE